MAKSWTFLSSIDGNFDCPSSDKAVLTAPQNTPGCLSAPEKHIWMENQTWYCVCKTRGMFNLGFDLQFLFYLYMEVTAT